MIPNRWYKSKVLPGERSGRTIGFPTINLSPNLFDKSVKKGIYACLIKYENEMYKGILFFGPRLVKKEKHSVLEVYVIDFDKEIYNTPVEFKLVSYIRRVKNFDSMDQLAEEIKKDVRKTEKAFLHL